MDPLPDVVGGSTAIVELREQARRLLALTVGTRRVPPILIRGETGTGKGLLARSLHRASSRSRGPFVTVNCSAIPENLLEAELFGFERGAFTGAVKSKAGLFQSASGGTCFLDEIGLLPEPLQAKLLSVLDEGAVRRLGSTRSEPVDCWFIAATNADLDAARRTQRFREDLYYRLSVLTITVPPLRDRGNDVQVLAEYLLADMLRAYGLPDKRLAPDARTALARYAWPGNVRELANVLERAALLATEADISSADLGLPDRADATALRDALESEPAPEPLRQSLDGLERSRLERALERTDWNIARAAEQLGVPRNTLRYRMSKQGLTPPGRRAARRPRARAFLHGATENQVGFSAPTVTARPRAVSFLRVICAAAGPEPWLATQGMDLAAAKVTAFGGSILRRGDDGIDAAFGLDPIEDAAGRAANAALAIRRLSEASREHPESRLASVIETVNCLVEEDERRKWRLTSQSHYEAVRALAGLTSRAGSELIVVGPTAAPYLERQFVLAGTVSVGEQTRARLVRRDAFDTKPGAALSQRRSPFVGREHELRFLEQRLDQVRATGRGHLIGLMGEPGMGKSRLLIELHQALTRQGIAVVDGACAAHLTMSPYSSLADLVRRAWRLDELQAGDDNLVRAVEQRLAALGLLDCAPEVLVLLGLPAQPAPSNPESMKGRIFGAVRRLLFAEAPGGTLAVLLDDAHWADQTSREFLGLLADSLPGTRAFVVVSTRPGDRSPWLDRSWASQLALAPLTVDDSRAMVRALRADLSDEAVSSIVSRAGGNAFFLEELTIAVGGHSAGNATVPTTITEALGARMDRLPLACRRLLESAAVVGREVPTALLAQVTGTSVEALAAPLAQLREMEFVYERPGAVVFKHALTQEVAYARLDERERQRQHAAVGRALEATVDGQPDSVPQLAHHFVAAGEIRQAIEYLVRAADRSLASYALADAQVALRKALVHVEQLPADQERDRLVLDLVARQTTILVRMGAFEEARDLLSRHADVAGRANRRSA